MMFMNAPNVEAHKVTSRSNRPLQLAAFFIRPLPPHFVQRGGYILRPGAGCSTGSTPMPLQAGHLSSTLSSLIRFIAVEPPLKKIRDLNQLRF
jgi:hypothetical protein